MFNFFRNKIDGHNFVDYNIEYAHIYSDEEFGAEQIAAIVKAKEVIVNLERQNKTYSLTVLIDEYHPNKTKFSVKGFVKKLEKYGLAPDFVGLESKLVAYKQEILGLFSAKEAREFDKFFQKRAKINCSFLIVGWYLTRLGLMPLKKDLLIKISKNNKPFYGRHLMNILDKKYKQTENNAYHVIHKTSQKDHIKDIEVVFY